MLRLEAARRACRSDLTAWCVRALADRGQSPAAHHRLLIRHLTAVADGRIDRLMVLMPPGSAKSTYASVLFPAWWFARHPRSAVIAASHTAELAEHFGRQVRNLVTQHADTLGYTLTHDSRAVGRWATDKGGEYFAAGVRGKITGRRADFAVIDDPVASQEEANSQDLRDKTWSWYQSDLYTRLKPGARVALIMTRWHQDDLGGRLLAAQADDGDAWTVIKLPALADAGDPLGRAPGEPLWPEWETADALTSKRAAVGERTWQSLYQQNPLPAGGSLFRVERMPTVDAPPAGMRMVRAWDFAATAQFGSNNPDWTVGVLLGRHGPDRNDQRFYVCDVVRLRGPPEDVRDAILKTAQRDGRGVRVGLPQDPGQAGKQQVADLTAKLAGYRVESSPETGSKITRAEPVSAQVNVGNVSLVAASWNAKFADELRDFPGGMKDDQVDALSRAFGMLLTAPGTNWAALAGAR